MCCWNVPQAPQVSLLDAERRPLPLVPSALQALPQGLSPHPSAGWAQTASQPRPVLFSLPRTLSPYLPVKIRGCNLEAQFKQGLFPSALPNHRDPDDAWRSCMANSNMERPLPRSSRRGLRGVQLLACRSSSLALRLSRGWCPPLHARHRASMPRVYCPWGACLGVIHSLCQGTAQVPRTVLGTRLQGFKRQTSEGLRG